MQKSGSFKFRGACNDLFLLTEQELQYGIATHSSGNHAAALAHAAQLCNTFAYIVMPENAPQLKQKAVAGYGGQISYCKATLIAREQALAEIV